MMNGVSDDGSVCPIFMRKVLRELVADAFSNTTRVRCLSVRIWRRVTRTDKVSSCAKDKGRAVMASRIHNITVQSWDFVETS